MILIVSDMNEAQLIGKDIKWDWTGSVFRPHWKLTYEGRTVASLFWKKTSLFTGHFEGSYDSMPVRIDYDKKSDVATFTNTDDGQIIGTLTGIREYLKSDYPKKDGVFINSNGDGYSLMFDEALRGHVFINKSGALLGMTVIIYRNTPNRSFRLLTDDIGLMNPWLIALIGHYWAINALGTDFTPA